MRGKEAVALDAGKNEVTVRDADTGDIEACSYDRLVIATGASPAKLPVKGTDLQGVFTMRTPDDAEGIRRYIEENQVRRAVVIGAGFIGLEAADNLKEQGIGVTVIDFASQILPNILDPEMAAYARKHLLGQGIRVITGTNTGRLSGDGNQDISRYIALRGPDHGSRDPSQYRFPERQRDRDVQRDYPGR